MVDFVFKEIAMKKIVSIFIVIVLSLGLCSAFSAENLTQRQVIENFKNGVYTGDWVPSTLSEDTVREMAENGIQYTFLWNFSWDNPSKVQELDWCKKYGIKVFLKDYKIDGLKMKDMTTDEIYEIIKRSIGDPAILGYGIFDEPAESAYEDLAICLEKFYSVSEGMIATVNLYPDMYGSYIDRVFTTLKQDFVSVDIYPLMGDATDPEYYFNLKEVGDSACKHGGDYWLFIQSMGWNAKRKPDIYDMRWQFYSGLAFGVTKFMHFCYSNPAYYPTYDPNFKADCVAAVNDGVKSDLYPVIQQFNAEMQFLAPIVSSYSDQGAFYIEGDNIPISDEPSYISRIYGLAQYEDFRTLKTISSDQYLLVGAFNHNTDSLKKGFVVVNASDVADEAEADVAFTLRYSSDPVTVTMDGHTFSLTADEHGVYHLHLGAGGGAFIEVSERERSEEETLIDQLYKDCNAVKNTYLDMARDPTVYESESYRFLETVVQKYNDKLVSDSMTKEELEIAVVELQAALEQVRTVMEIAVESAEKLNLWYSQIDTEVFDKANYKTLSDYMVMLNNELNSPTVSAKRLSILVQVVESTFNKMTFIGISGDMNRDGKVSLADIMISARYVVQLDSFHYTAMRIGDMNGDFVLKLDDVILMAKQVIGS